MSHDVHRTIDALWRIESPRIVAAVGMRASIASANGMTTIDGKRDARASASASNVKASGLRRTAD